MAARQFVLDASVALEWFLPEAASIHPYAAAVLAAIDRNDITPAVPDLWHYELASALLTAKRSGRIGAAKLKAATANLAAFQSATLVLQLTARSGIPRQPGPPMRDRRFERGDRLALIASGARTRTRIKPCANCG